jgi:hypothetical protein
MQIAILIIQAAILAIIVIGGIWLRYVVNQQLALKKSEIEVLQAEKERLEGLKAPAIIAEHKAMKEFAEDMTRQNQRLQEALKQFEDEKGRAESGAYMKMLKGMGIAFLDGAGTIDRIIEYRKKATNVFAQLELDAMLQEASALLYKQAATAFDGKRPSLSNVARFALRWRTK